jgi:serine/threonine-protein phosphatase 2A regulatory subunit B''
MLALQQEALARVQKYIQDHPCVDYDSKLKADTVAHAKKLQQKKRSSTVAVSAAPPSSAPPADSSIPRFYFPLRPIRPSFTALQEEEVNDSFDPDMEIQAAGLRLMIRSVVKKQETDLRMKQLSLIDGDISTKLWELFTNRCSVGRMTYKLFQTVAEEFERWRKVYYEQEHPDVDYDEVVQSLEKPQAFHVSSLPRVDATLFVLDSATSASPKTLYQAFVQQTALFKIETELVERDDDCDGFLLEDELRSYVEDLTPNTEVLKDLDSELLPFYCCSTVRRLFWLLDPKCTGRIRIDQLVTHSVMQAWLDVQLACVDPARNWFSKNIGTALHAKFVQFNTSGSGMLSLSEMLKYKKGLPTVMDDGLPPDVTPLNELFIERAFETMPLFNGEMDYQGFVDFVQAVELLPQCPRPNFFWDIFDIHQEGYLTPMTVNLFFRNVHKKLVDAGVPAPALDLIVPELFEIIETKERLKMTKEEFFKSKENGLFSSLLIDCLSFWNYENREQQMVQKHQQQQQQS